MENTGTLHSPSQRFVGHFDIVKALRSTLGNRKNTNSMFGSNPALPSWLGLGAPFLRSPD